MGISLLALIQPWFGEDNESVSLQNEKGKVWLSSKTISEYIQRKSASIEDIENLRVQVEPKGEQVSLNVEVSVQGESPLPKVTERIQEFIERELKETIGVEKIEGIHIHFKKIGGAPAEVVPSLDHRPPSIAGKEDAVETEAVEANLKN